MTASPRGGISTTSAIDSRVAAVAHAKYEQALALHHKGQLAQAQQTYLEVLRLVPEHADALHLLGVIAAQSGEFGKAVTLISRSLEINPGNAVAHANLGNALKDLGHYQAAVASYDRAMAIKPDYANARGNRNLALQALRHLQAAGTALGQAMSIQPDGADVHFQRGVELSAAGQFEAAIESYGKAIAIRPDFANAYFNRGNALNELQQRQGAIDNYEKAIALNPANDLWRYVKFATSMFVCDWRDFQSQWSKLRDNIERGGSAFFPFQVLSLADSLAVQRKAAERWIQQRCPRNDAVGPVTRHARRDKIRVAYFSMDFCIHPVAILTAALFETHDRDRFEVFAFSYGPNTKDEMRLRLEGAFDRFMDVQHLSDAEVARMARNLDVDIAVDLAGLTGTSRLGIFALRAAPVQVSYIGYPGTTGADYMDYLIADRRLIPQGSEGGYAEKIVFLPSFQVNDSGRRISQRQFTREELGLPPSGFVFCCFNKNYKLTPGTFDGWMNILKQVEASVLFLYAESEPVVANLRREAAERGVDAGRLVFGRHLPAPEYLARYRCADLFLDTFPFNAGATASDALWAGLPVLTLAGETFASRMGASLLTAIELPELITATQRDYEALAVELAKDPVRLTSIKAKLERNRLSTRLFDTRRFAQDLENAYSVMCERQLAGLPPEHILIA